MRLSQSEVEAAMQTLAKVSESTVDVWRTLMTPLVGVELRELLTRPGVPPEERSAAVFLASHAVGQMIRTSPELIPACIEMLVAGSGLEHAPKKARRAKGAR